MRFLVFIPNCPVSDLEARAKVSGLSHLIADADKLATKGPNGNDGIMLGWPDPETPLMHVDKASQTWVPSFIKADGASLYHVGYWTDKPPTESELRRPYTQAGNLVDFGGGGDRWKLPTPDTVDAKAVYNDDGSMRWQVVREFAWMCDEADKLHDTYVEEFAMREMVFRAEPSAQIDWLLKLLQVNYRLTAEIAHELDLWIGRERLMDAFLMSLGLVRKGDD